MVFTQYMVYSIDKSLKPGYKAAEIQRLSEPGL